jgi:hypothetical protein
VRSTLGGNGDGYTGPRCGRDALGRAGCPATGLVTGMISCAVRSPTRVSRRGSVKSDKPREFIEQVDHDHGAVDRCLGVTRSQRRTSAGACCPRTQGSNSRSASRLLQLRFTMGWHHPSHAQSSWSSMSRRWRFGAGFWLVFFGLALLAVASRSLLAMAGLQHGLSAILSTARSLRGASSLAIFKVP